jgi:hypothetical protein
MPSSFAKGTKETRSAGLRYTLPEGREIALSDLGLRSQLDLFQKILDAPDRPLGLIPTFADVVAFLSEVLDTCIASIGEPHYVFRQPNPEVISTGQVTPAKEAIVESAGRGSRTLGLSPTDEADEVAIVSHPSTSGLPESEVRRQRGVRQDGKEPIPFYRMLLGLRTLLADIAENIGRITTNKLPLAVEAIASLLEGTPFQGAPRGVMPKLGPRSSSIAALAAANRRLRRKSKGQQSQGRANKQRRKSS